ncbi:MAG: amidohydrolase, partial [Dolichospermum sp.]
MTKYSKLKSSPSAAVRANLDYPVIDTDVHTNDFTPALEDYIAHYGGVKLVDELRKAEFYRLNSKIDGKDWYQQTPEERQYNRTLRSPWWARVTRNTLDLATYTLPALLYERQGEQGSDYSVLFPNNALAAAGASKENRQLLQRAINHYHADIYRKYSDSYGALRYR